LSPAPRIAHQEICRLLTACLLPQAKAAKLRVTQDINVRLGPDRIVEPDVTVASADRLAVMAHAPEVALIALRLLHLDGKRYVEHAVAKHGETLSSDLPFPFEMSTEALADF